MASPGVGTLLGEATRGETRHQTRSAPRAWCGRSSLSRLLSRRLRWLLVEVEKLLVDVVDEERELPDTEAPLDEELGDRRCVQEKNGDGALLVGRLRGFSGEATSRQVHPVIKLTLDGAAELVYLRSPDGAWSIASLGRPTGC